MSFIPGIPFSDAVSCCRSPAFLPRKLLSSLRADRASRDAVCRGTLLILGMETHRKTFSGAERKEHFFRGPNIIQTLSRLDICFVFLLHPATSPRSAFLLFFIILHTSLNIGFRLCTSWNFRYSNFKVLGIRNLKLRVLTRMSKNLVLCTKVELIFRDHGIII